LALDTYRRKRRFGRTPEPRGEPIRRATAPAEPTAGRFVVQRHRARRLHYDFRLEIDGVLASWAVPRGPTLDPRQRRLAVQVEDHPLGYFSFEGVIPRREYGGGDVIVWDWGHWLAEGSTTDAGKGLHDGELKLRLEGQKLHGAFVLLRMRWVRGSRNQWLLIKRRDEHAVPGWDAEGHPESVKTGRTNDEVAKGVRPKTRRAPPKAVAAHG
jgi:bifunctional non-homologous end joining protein LigD